MTIQGNTFSDTLSVDAAHQTPGKWQHVSHTFQSIMGDTLTIKLSITKRNTKANSQLDNFQLSYAAN